MSLKLSALCGLILLLATPSHAQNRLEEIYKVTEAGAWLGGSIDQAVTFSTARDTLNPKRWIVERIKKDIDTCAFRNSQDGCAPTEIVRHDWIDSDQCPALVSALERLSRISIPPFAGATNIQSFWASHATDLKIEGRPVAVKSLSNPLVNMTITRISIEEQIGPFHEWWKETGVALKACWQEDAPSFDGARIIQRLHILQ